MNTDKKPLSIKIIYWLTQVVFWLFIAALILIVGLNVAIYSEVFGDSMQLHAAMPVEVSYTKKGTLEVFGVTQQVEFVEAFGKIHFIDTNPDFAKVFSSAALIVVIIGLYIFTMFRRFIGNVYRGFIFEEYNIQMLKKMSYGLVVLWLFDVIYKPIFYYLIVKNIEFEDLTFTENFDTNAIILLIALMLWVLSHIFMYGVKLRKEQELTV